MAYQRSWYPPKEKAVEGANKYFICLAYDPFKGVTEKMLLVMTVETELRGNWYGGRVITINGKEYVLGPKNLDKKSGISSWELVSRNLPGLSFND